jgi:hypothetical protein
VQIDDRVKLLIERIEQFPEEFEQIEGNFTHLKWLSWFKRHFDSLNFNEKADVLTAVQTAKRKLALEGIVETITSGNESIYDPGVLWDKGKDPRMQGTTHSLGTPNGTVNAAQADRATSLAKWIRTAL